jgi:hypothetical protein
MMGRCDWRDGVPRRTRQPLLSYRYRPRFPSPLYRSTHFSSA